MTKLEKLNQVIAKLSGKVESSIIPRCYIGSRVSSAAKKKPGSDATRIADEYIAMWDELPISQQKPVKKESNGKRKSGITKAQTDAKLDELLKAVTPKIKMAVSPHLHDGYLMADAIADAYQRIWRYIIPTWDKKKQKDFEKQVGLAVGSWASTMARKYKHTTENETGLTYTDGDGEEVEKNIGHAKDKSSEVEFNETIRKVTKGDKVLKDIVEYLIDNYDTNPKVLKKNVIKELKLQEGEYEEAIKRISDRLLDIPVKSSRRVRSSTINGWRLVDTKSVPDSDGFLTDYTLYAKDGVYICMFGDTDIYEPDEDDADFVTESRIEAFRWFENYEGLVDEDYE